MRWSWKDFRYNIYVHCFVCKKLRESSAIFSGFLFSRKAYWPNPQLHMIHWKTRSNTLLGGFCHLRNQHGNVIHFTRYKRNPSLNEFNKFKKTSALFAMEFLNFKWEWFANNRISLCEKGRWVKEENSIKLMAFHQAPLAKEWRRKGTT